MTQKPKLDLSFIDLLDKDELKLELADRVRLIQQLREHRDMLLDLLVANPITRSEESVIQ